MNPKQSFSNSSRGPVYIVIFTVVVAHTIKKERELVSLLGGDLSSPRVCKLTGLTFGTESVNWNTDLIELRYFCDYIIGA